MYIIQSFVLIITLIDKIIYIYIIYLIDIWFMIEYKIILILQLLIIILNQLYYNIIRIYLCYDKNNSL